MVTEGQMQHIHDTGNVESCHTQRFDSREQMKMCLDVK